MFDPSWENGCPGCTGFVDALGDLSMLKDKDTTFAVVSRAPLAKLEAYKAKKPDLGASSGRNLDGADPSRVPTSQTRDVRRKRAGSVWAPLG